MWKITRNTKHPELSKIEFNGHVVSKVQSFKVGTSIKDGVATHTLELELEMPELQVVDVDTAPVIPTSKYKPEDMAPTEEELKEARAALKQAG